MVLDRQFRTALYVVINIIRTEFLILQSNNLQRKAFINQIFIIALGLYLILYRHGIMS